MTTQSFYTPDKAAEVLGCKAEAVLAYIKSGQLKASFMSNIANYVITHNDLMAFLKATRDFKTMQKMLTRRIIIVALERGVTALLDAVRTRFGLKTSANTTIGRRPLA